MSRNFCRCTWMTAPSCGSGYCTNLRRAFYAMVPFLLMWRISALKYTVVVSYNCAPACVGCSVPSVVVKNRLYIKVISFPDELALTKLGSIFRRNSEQLCNWRIQFFMTLVILWLKSKYLTPTIFSFRKTLLLGVCHKLQVTYNQSTHGDFCCGIFDFCCGILLLWYFVFWTRQTFCVFVCRCSGHWALCSRS